MTGPEEKIITFILYHLIILDWLERILVDNKNGYFNVKRIRQGAYFYALWLSSESSHPLQLISKIIVAFRELSIFWSFFLQIFIIDWPKISDHEFIENGNIIKHCLKHFLFVWSADLCHMPNITLPHQK